MAAILKERYKKEKVDDLSPPYLCDVNDCEIKFLLDRKLAH